MNTSAAPAPAETPTLLVVGHGTRRAAGAEQFRALVARIGRRAATVVRAGADGAVAPSAVRGGFMELSEPSVDTVIDELVAAGTTEVVVVPLLLVRGGHYTTDIPEILDKACRRNPALTVRYAQPLGPSEALHDLVTRRIDAAIADDLTAARADTSVVLVSNGASDPAANAEIARVSNVLWQELGYRAAGHAFAGFGEPRVAEVLEKVRLGGANRIVLAPYILFSGVLTERIEQDRAAFAERFAEVDLRCAAPLGDCDELADLVLERYRQVLG